MDESKDLVESIRDSLTKMVEDIVEKVPQFLFALIIYIVGVIVSNAIARLARAVLGKFENVAAVKSIKEKASLNFSLANIVATVLRWVTMLIFMSAAVDQLGITVVSDTFKSLVDNAPRVFGAVVIAGITIVAARIVRDLVGTALKEANLEHAGIIKNVAYAAILIFGIPTALAQVMDVSLVTDNLTNVITGAIAAAALAFGWGGRGMASNILASNELKKIVKPGNTIQTTEGAFKVKEVTRSAVVVAGDKGDIIIPNSDILG